MAMWLWVQIRFCSVCSVFKIWGTAEKDLFFEEGRIFDKNMYVCQKIVVFIKK
jgi:hypothetical protein